MKKFFVVFIISVLSIYFMGSTRTDYYEIVENMGYECIHKPYEISEIEIPMVFGKVYENYNALLKKGGYDLSLYKGKKCTRYTYLLKSGERANVYVYLGRIIGGDISSVRLDGMMIPLLKKYEKD